MAADLHKPYVRIFEQPAERRYRFRYRSEGRLNGSIPGANSIPTKPTYPAIEIGNFVGVAEIHISCVTHNHDPPRQHPHGVVAGKDTNELMMNVHVNQRKLVAFRDIGIVCVRKEDIVKSLEEKRKKNIDPTNGGWKHIATPYKSIDLRCVRLCFDVKYIEEDNNWKHLGYVLSDLIYDKKSNGQLKIVDISSRRSPANGGKRIILLCDKVKREDIAVVFYEEDSGRKTIWREEINYKNSSMRVHHQYAISFLTPEYKDVDIYQSRKTYIQLYRPSDCDVGDPLEFEFIPNRQSTRLIQKKKKRINERSREILESIMQLKKAEKMKYSPSDSDAETINKNKESTANPQLLVDIDQDIKKENQNLLDNSIQNQFQSLINGFQNNQRPTTANVNLIDETYGSCQNNFPQYYYNSYKLANSYFGEASHTPYSPNPAHILMPSTSAQSNQQPKQQPQLHQLQSQQPKLHQVQSEQIQSKLPQLHQIQSEQPQSQQPQLHQLQSQQPQLYKIQSQQPKLHQVQSEQIQSQLPQSYKIQSQQPQLHQIQSQQPQFHQVQLQQPQSQPQLHQVQSQQPQSQQPQLHRLQSQQPQLHQIQSQQPQFHQVQSEQPQSHQLQSQQPQLHQVQSEQTQLHQIQSQQPTSSGAMNTFRNEYSRYFIQPTTSTPIPNNTNVSPPNNVNDLLTITDEHFPEFDSKLFDIDTDINDISENLDSMKISTYDN